LRYALVALAVVVFLGISFLVARVLAADSRERSDVADLMRAQAQGDAGSMLRQLTGCAKDPRCAAQARANAARLKRPGAVKLVRFDPSTTFALSPKTATARVVWNTDKALRPVVQCVIVQRTGDVLSGPGVRLRYVSAQRPGTSSC
jgi:hypothetical protein